MAHVLHNNRVKFPKDYFLFCSVHQHGGDDVSWKPPIGKVSVFEHRFFYSNVPTVGPQEKKTFVSKANEVLVGISIGSLRNHDADGNKNVINLHIWQWKAIDLHALHVQFSFLFISQRFSFFPRREMTCFAVAWTTWAYDDKRSILASYLWSAGCNLIPGLLKHILQA